MTKFLYVPLRARKACVYALVFLVPLLATMDFLYFSLFSTARLRRNLKSIYGEVPATLQPNASPWFLLEGKPNYPTELHRSLGQVIPGTEILENGSRSLPPAPLGPLLDQHRTRQEKMRRGEVPLRAVIIRCIRYDMCGGLGDRLFGVVMLFMMALLADRAVFIEQAKPLPQADYLVPGAVDWRIDSVQNEAVKAALREGFQTAPYNNMQLPYQKCSDLLNFNMHQQQPAILVMNSNFRTSCLLKLLLRKRFFPEPSDQGLFKTFNCSEERSLRFWASVVSHHILRHLFDFSPLVRSPALMILNETDLPVDFDAKETVECLICVHVRSGKNTFEGDRHHNIADFGQCAHMVEEGIRKADTCPRQVHWLVVSDHPDAPSIVGGNFSSPLSTNNVGPIVHVDRIGLGEEHRRGTTRLYVDFFLLSRCKHFVASLSTLGETASILHGPTVRRYDMDHSGMCSPTPSNIHNWQRDVHLSQAEWLTSLEHEPSPDG